MKVLPRPASLRTSTRAVVQFDELLGDDQAQARTRVMARGSGIQLLELPEQFSEVLLADPDPLVDHHAGGCRLAESDLATTVTFPEGWENLMALETRLYRTWRTLPPSR